MRSSNRAVGAARGRSRRVGRSGALVVVAIVVAACGASAAPTPAPTAAPTPVITPDPHLKDPATIQVVYRALVAAGLKVTANTASTAPSGEPVKQISATYDNWPLILSEFSSGAALAKRVAFDPKKGPRAGDAPYVLAGLNILVEFGPKTTNAVPKVPPAERRADALALVAALDPLLGPLSQRSIDPLQLPNVPATAAPSTRPSPTPRP
jgi:hypothetical protein